MREAQLETGPGQGYAQAMIDSIGSSLAAFNQAEARLVKAVEIVSEGGLNADALAAAAQLIAQAQQQQATAGVTLRAELDQKRRTVDILA